MILHHPEGLEVPLVLEAAPRASTVEHQISSSRAVAPVACHRAPVVIRFAAILKYRRIIILFVEQWTILLHVPLLFALETFAPELPRCSLRPPRLRGHQLVDPSLHLRKILRRHVLEILGPLMLMAGRHDILYLGLIVVSRLPCCHTSDRRYRRLVGSRVQCNILECRAVLVLRESHHERHDPVLVVHGLAQPGECIRRLLDLRSQLPEIAAVIVKRLTIQLLL
mmetsp:Transcript_25632/g.40534  ORF Transcript_25632/g.40534 Transcript_25632/m.40534 type:complete len:224 (-) Transcript_25632:1947-2618(-)